MLIPQGSKESSDWFHHIMHHALLIKGIVLNPQVSHQLRLMVGAKKLVPNDEGMPHVLVVVTCRGGVVDPVGVG